LALIELWAPHHQAAELHTSMEKPEDMNTSDRGLKHVCPECAIKYYDLKKEVVVCPKCGAKPATSKVLKSAQPAKKTGPKAFGRYSQ